MGYGTNYVDTKIVRKTIYEKNMVLPMDSDNNICGIFIFAFNIECLKPIFIPRFSKIFNVLLLYEPQGWDMDILLVVLHFNILETIFEL